MSSLLPRERREDAFTIMELMVTILIIGVLASISVGSFLDARKKSQDTHTRDTLTAIAVTADTWVVKSSDPRTLDLSVLNTGRIEGITAGTVVGIRGEQYGYCASAWHQGGHNDEASPVLWDSVSNAFIYKEDDIRASGVCSISDLTNAIEPAYKVSEGQLERLTPADAPLPNVCNGVEPYTYWTDIEAKATNGETYPLVGEISLSDDCREITYELRVKNADETMTYFFPLSFTNKTTGGSDSGGYAINVPIDGKETVESSIPTKWNTSSNWTAISLNDAWNPAGVAPTWSIPGTTP